MPPLIWHMLRMKTCLYSYFFRRLNSFTKNGDTVSDVCISYAGPEPEHIQKVNKDGSALYLRQTHYVVT